MTDPRRRSPATSSGWRGWWRDFHWTVVGLAALTAVVLGTVAYAKVLWGSDGTPTLPQAIARLLEAFYRSLRLFVLEAELGDPDGFPAEGQVARFLAPTVSVYAAIQAVLLLFRDQFDRARLRLLFRDHVVIFGGGPEATRLAEAFRARGDRVVVIDEDPDRVELQPCRAAGVILLAGDGTHPAILAQARIDRARYLFAVSPRDGANAEAAAQAERLRAGTRPGSLTCYVQVDGIDLGSLLREEAFAARRPDAPVRLEFFHLFESAARILLDRFPLPVDEPGRPAHVMVVGVGRLGWSLVVRAARDRFLRASPDAPRMRITVVDRLSRALVQELVARHRDLERAVELRALPPEALRAGEATRALDSEPRAAYVCLADESEAITAALAIRRYAAGRRIELPIVVRVREELGLARLLPQHEVSILPFGVLDRACSVDLLTGGTTETIARALHARYVESERAKGETAASNPALVPFDELGEDDRESNRAQADFLGTHLREEGYRLVPLVHWDAHAFEFPDDVVERLSRAEHERWRADRESRGYGYAERRDRQAKTHPNLVDWERLPDEERQKDRDFVREWPRVLYLAGFEIERS